MSLSRRFRLLALAALRGAGLIARRHYFSLVTAVVLAGIAVVVLSDDSFESSNREPFAAQAGEDSPPEPNWPRRERRVVLFYLVDDAAQRDQLAAAQHADRFAFAGPVRPPDYVIYLIAGTKEEEVQTIERLNFEELLARQGGVDMRVIDVRTGTR